MKLTRVGIQIKRVKNDSGVEALKATVPVQVVFQRDFNAQEINKNLARFESEYRKLIENLTAISKLIKNRRGEGRVLLYWMLGDELQELNERWQNSPFFLERPLSHFTRDTGISKKLLQRCQRFRRCYPNMADIDLSRSFDSYVRSFEQGYLSAKKRTAVHKRD